MSTSLIIALVVGYILGSIPFGYLVARAKGVNIFEVGSKNPGATNVRRVLGSSAGNLVFALDAVKGAVAAAWPPLFLLERAATAAGSDALEIATGRGQLAIVGLVGALIGHSFSCFTAFRGGKGVATAAGGLLVIIPQALLISALVWVLTFYASRYVSLASMLAAVALPVAVFSLGERSMIFGVTVAIGAFVIVRHRSNIQRLLAGTENKTGQVTPISKP